MVLGDRWELLYAVPPAVLRGVPLVHLHGGEVTEGAMDDRIRHAVSKLADLHCVSTEARGGPAAPARRAGRPGRSSPAPRRWTASRRVEPATDAELEQLLGRPGAAGRSPW